MGGGRKKDRTKGCAKPSSSARSAELLASTAFSEPIGFGDVSSTSSSLLESFVIGDDVPSELKVILKKLSKKDEVTRLKAVEELNKLLEDSGESLVKGLLPHWPRTYAKIANDHCRRIRTGAQAGHLLVVKHAGRDLAPQLKSLAPIWFISCSDPHAPAASNAAKSFSLAFTSEAKMREAVRFCLVDIMAAIEDNLLNSSINAFKDENLSAEDAENKYYRVVSSSLLAFASLLDYLSPDLTKKISSQMEKLLESVKFWKYSKNKNTMVRSSWFRLICKMCEKSKELSIFNEELYAKLIPLLFNNLSESDPIVAPLTWDSCLYIMLSYPPWKELAPEGGLLPQIIAFLEAGCEGNGREIYPKLLPFLSCLSLEKEKHFRCSSDGDICSRILAAIRGPFGALKSGQQSKALLLAYFELCRYFEKLRRDAGSKREDEDAVMEDVFNWLESVLLCTELSHAPEMLFNFLDKYLSYNQDSPPHWTRTRSLISKAVSSHHFKCLSELLRAFNKINSAGKSIVSGKQKKFSFADDDDKVQSPSKSNVRKFEASKVTGIASEMCRFILFVDDYWTEDSLALVSYAIRSYGEQKGFFEDLIIPHDSKAVAASEHVSGVLIFIKKLRALQAHDQSSADLIASSSLFLIRPEEILEFHGSIVCTGSKEEFTRLLRGLTRLPEEGIRSSLVRSVDFENKFMESVESAGKSLLSLGGPLNEEKEEWLMIKDVCSKYGKFLSNELLEKIIREFLNCIVSLNSNKPSPQQQAKGGHIISLVSNILETIVLLENGEVFLRLESKKDLLLSLFRISCREEEPDQDDSQALHTSWTSILKVVIDKEEEGFMEPFLQGVADLVVQQLKSNDSLESNTMAHGAIKQLLSLISPDQRVLLLKGILLKDDNNEHKNFPSKELLFERQIFPTSVLDMDFIDFESEMLRRKRILHFFSGLTHEISEVLKDSTSDSDQEGFHRSLASLLLYETSLRFDRGDERKGGPQGTSSSSLEDVFKSLGASEGKRMLEYVCEESKATGGSWSLVLSRLINILDMPPALYEGTNLNHREVIIDHMASKEDLSKVSSRILNEVTRLQEDRMTEVLALASRIISKVEDPEELSNACFAAIKTKRDEVDFLFSCDIGGMEWDSLTPTLSVIEFFDSYLELVVKRSPESKKMMDSERWVFLLCFVSSWIQTIDESKEAFATRVEIQRFALPIFRIIEKLGCSLNALQGDSDAETQRLFEEWKEFFSGGIYDVVLRLFVTHTSGGEIHGDVIRALNGALGHIPLEILHEGSSLPPKFLEEDLKNEGMMPENLTFLLNHLGPLVLSPNPSIQTTSAQLLLKLMSKISELESVRSEKSKEEESPSLSLPHRIIYLLNSTEPIVKNIFEEFSFGEPVIINESVDESVKVYLRAYLYTCRLLLELVASANQELRPSWTEFIRNRDFLNSLVPVLFSLMRINESRQHYTDANSTDIQEIAFNIYHDLLKFLPAMFRHWFNNSDHRISQIVEKFTIQFVSPLLWAKESKNIISSQTTFQNMTVGVRTSVREVVAVYSLDEGSMDLIISLPNNFPLGPVKVDRHQRIGVGNNQWRKWMLQLTTFLEHQNGSILEGLIIWKNNVDKRFEGVEECCICFYILHGANHTLPKLTCRTCRKKFHSACLYKWFSTSNNSTCPMCRNLF